MNRQGIELKWLLLGMFLGSIGNSFVWPLTTIYMHQQLHESLTVSGIVLLLYSGANVVGSYIAGTLFDKKNPRQLMLGGTVTATVIMALLIAFNGWPVYGILLTGVGFMNGWIITMVNSYGTQSGQDGRYVFNMLYFANNLGMVIGTTIVGPLYQYAHGNISPMFSITTVLYVLFSAVVFFLGCIYYFVLPYILARMAYRSFLDQAKGKDCKMKITITEEEITVENKMTKSKEVYSTSIVNKIREKRDAICLLTDRNLGVFLSKSGFTHGNRDDLYFIFNKSRSKGRGV